MRKAKTVEKTKLVKFTGYGPDWFNYPPEWDVQAKKLQEEWEKAHSPKYEKIP